MISFSFSWDRVTIYESLTSASAGSPVSAGPYCGSTIPPKYKSTGDLAVVVFISDYSVTKTGFEISYVCKNITNTTTTSPSSTTNTPISTMSTITSNTTAPPVSCGKNARVYFFRGKLLLELWVTTFLPD